MRHIAVLIVLFVASTAFAAPTVRLELDEKTMLPGTQVAFSVFVDNPAATPLQLPSLLWLTALGGDSGKAFVVRCEEDREAWALPEKQRVIAAGGTLELRFDAKLALFATAWFNDTRLTMPGSYALRAVFAEAVRADGSFGDSALVSPAEQLTVVIPSGEDAAVWKWMLARGGGKWGDHLWPDFAAFVVNEHPTSGYALFAATYGMAYGSDHPTPFLLEAVKRFAGRSYDDQLKVALAEHHLIAAQTAAYHHDAQRKAEELELLHAIHSDLITNSRSILVREWARVRERQVRATLTP